MDIETANQDPVRQASEDDLRGILAGDFGSTVTLVRNYGDRFEAAAEPGAGYRLTYYDAVSGRRWAALEALSLDQVKEAFCDYFQGNWNWHGRQTWRPIELV